MTQPYSMDLRSRVVSAVFEDGLSARAAAVKFGVSISSSIRWVALFRQHGHFDPQAQGGDHRSATAERWATTILSWIAEVPDISLAEIQSRLQREHKVQLALARQTRHDVQKKTGHAAEQEREDVKAKRQAWFDNQEMLDPKRLIFIDETGANTKMARTRGRQSGPQERLTIFGKPSRMSLTNFTHGSVQDISENADMIMMQCDQKIL